MEAYYPTDTGALIPVGRAARQPSDPETPGGAWGAQLQHPAPCPALAADRGAGLAWGLQRQSCFESIFLCGWWPLSGGSPRARDGAAGGTGGGGLNPLF